MNPKNLLVHLPVRVKAEKLHEMAEQLVELATDLRMNITIERVNVPPLAMGNVSVVVTAWPMRDLAEPIQRQGGRT